MYRCIILFKLLKCLNVKMCSKDQCIKIFIKNNLYKLYQHFRFSKFIPWWRIAQDDNAAK